MEPQSTWEKFAYVARKVWTAPLSLLLWAVGGVALFNLVNNADVRALGPIAFVAVAQGGLLLWRLRDDAFLRRVFRKRQEDQDLAVEQQIEAQLDQLDFETRQRIRYILQLQRELAREARTSDVEAIAREELDRVASQLAPLVQRAVRLASRKQQLTRYLQNVDERALKSYCSSLRQRIEATTDSVTRAQYEHALSARETELQTYQTIAQAADRIDSQLENVEATFASWKAKVIRIKTADLAHAATASQGLYQELGDLSQEIDLLDTSVSEALAGEEQVALLRPPPA